MLQCALSHPDPALLSPQTDQNRLQAELDFIQGQQQELEQLIEPLEAAAASTTPAQHQGDRQRENMHLVAQVSGFCVCITVCLAVCLPVFVTMLSSVFLLSA